MYVKPIAYLFIPFIFMTAAGCKKQHDQMTGPAIPVTIEQQDDGFQLYRDGEPFFIKGARTIRTRYMEEVAQKGGNAVRIGYNTGVEEVLDRAHSLGLTVLFGLPFRPERAGFDYNDVDAIKTQQDSLLKIVELYKDHPALLLWTIGNELDHIPGQEIYNLNMWNAVNEVAKKIHQSDPAHPVMTVIGTGRKEKLQDLVERCPDLDLLGVNSYADIYEVPDWLRKYHWNKPYAITEWGPSGHWQVPETKWGVVIEQTSTEKARVYRERYEQVIQSDPWCVGSFVFLWTSNRQERTHTWYNMFHDDGSAKEAVEVMQYVWTGEWPENRSPKIASLQIDGHQAADDINLMPNSQHTASVSVSDPEQDPLQIEWELVPENKEFGAYAGQGEIKPEPIEGAIINIQEDGQKIEFEAPVQPGDNFRLFVYVYDGHQNVAVANIPFHIGNE
ncbi:MAG: glycoside hydrolase family 2 TIM barrel-domain containing protein [Candidatus Cyclobacteriaceae bacterium M3_2C_046]